VPSFLEDIPEVRREVAEYYTGVRRFDRSFGEAMAALKAAGRDADTVVVFLSDHGMSFPFSKATVYRNGTWSPVLLRWPGMAAAKSDARIRARVDQLVVGVRLSFFDLEKDPDERVNRITDPAYRAEADRLAKLLLAHMERTNDPQLASFRAALGGAAK